MLKVQQHLKLDQKLSPQQIQFIKLLQLNNLALEQRISAELQTNPVLEEITELAEAPQEEASDDEGASNDEVDWDELFPSADDDFYGHKAQVAHAERPARPLPAKESLTEHLRAQCALMDLSPAQSLIAEQILGSIDEDGYMRRDVVSIVDSLLFTHGERVQSDAVEAILAKIQRLDPPGIAARDLRECLRIQLEALPVHMAGRDVALAMLSDCFDDFANKRFSRLKEKLDVDERTLKAAFDVILQLNPKPGEGTFAASENYITPDFEVRADGDEFTIALRSGQGARIRISPEYLKMLKRLKSRKRQARPGELETRQFLMRRLGSAREFVKAVNQRRHTMITVMRAIVVHQRDFFAHGPGHLKPLILQNIAETIDMDISTVSRVVAGKYVQCRFGIYALKYFFSEGVATRSGTQVSNREVKAIIEQTISQENKAHPLSDREITEQLTAREFLIARRTVSKYRKQLGIPVARMRREIVLDQNTFANGVADAASTTDAVKNAA